MYPLKAGTGRRLREEYYPFVLLAVIMLLYHLIFVSGSLGDDTTISGMLDQWPSMTDYLVNRYQTWSSRLLMEIIIYYVHMAPLVWRLLNTALLVLLAFSLTRLFPVGNIRNRNLLIAAMIFMYPLLDMMSAGWIATATSYLWPLSLGLYAMLPIRKTKDGTKIRAWEYPLFIGAMLVAGSTEQGCAIQFAVFAAFIFWFIQKKRFRNRALLITGLLIAAAGLALVFACPGNANRKLIELRWMPQYTDIPVVKKLEMGFSSTLTGFILDPNFIFLTFAVLLCTVTQIRNKNRKVIRILSFVPVFCSLVCGFFRSCLATAAPNLYDVLGQMTAYARSGVYSLDQGNMIYGAILLLDVIMAIVCLSVLVVLSYSFKNKRTALFAVLILLLGFASRMAITLSPTLYASGSRTCIYLYFAFVCVSLLLYGEFSDISSAETKRKWYLPAVCGISVCAVVAFLQTLMAYPIYP